ncbi:hypothetical protein ACWIFB_17210 [Dietzia sp. NPDC055340]|uniref:hypothetical protein n=1 Tax=Arthrobacter koreensis TaxID=199136 RepID=UPI00366F69E6
MATSPAYVIPGAEGIAAAYADMRRYNVAPLAASDWLIEQVKDAARDDIAQQLERNHGAPAEESPNVADLVLRQIYRAIGVALAVYNNHRSRVTDMDHIATPQGAAAINRAAVARKVRTNDTHRAIFEYTPDIDTVENGKETIYYVSGVIYIGPRVRALTARFTSTTNAPTAHSVTLTHFDVLLP